MFFAPWLKIFLITFKKCEKSVLKGVQNIWKTPVDMEVSTFFRGSFWKDQTPLHTMKIHVCFGKIALISLTSFWRLTLSLSSLVIRRLICSAFSFIRSWNCIHFAFFFAKESFSCETCSMKFSFCFCSVFTVCSSEVILASFR